MANAITGIDHGLIGVHDLEAARTNWERLGFSMTPRGRHTGWGTANYCIMFDDDYLELIGLVDPSQPSMSLEAALKKHEGLFGVALGSDDAREAHAALTAAGLAPEEISDLSRSVEMPGESQPAQPRFRIVKLPDSSTPDMNMFVCQHLDPSRVWRPEWQLHANGARGITSMTIAVDNPEPLISAYEKLFGAGSCSPTDDTLAAFTGHGSLMFVTRDDIKLIYPDVNVDESIETPFIVGVSLDVMTPGTTADYLTSAGVPFVQSDDGTVRVAPDQTNGGDVISCLQPARCSSKWGRVRARA
jgi:hypothetical protein